MSVKISIALSLIAVVWTSTIPPPGCIYNGERHDIGTKFQESPCYPCQCMQDGHVRCYGIECLLPCVDYVQDPTKCCPDCPNGENCEYKDGTIIKKGEVYRPDNNTMCQCPDDQFGFGTLPVAICRAV